MKRLALLLLVGATACSSAAGDDAGGDDASAPDANRTHPDAPSSSCPDGTTPGTMNGVAVCKNAAGIPRLDHIFVLVMENTSYSTLMSSNTPYIHSLITGGASATDYHGVEHPSLPNYIAMVSGAIDDNGAKDCDCQPSGDTCGGLTCNGIVSSCGCPQNHDDLADQLDAAGITWRAYAEDMGTACNLTGAGKYAPKHVPFLYFPSLTGDASRCADRVVDYSSFAGDLAAGPRRFTFLTPNLDHDMHDPVPAGAQNYTNGDAWLAQEVPPILASQAFQDHGLLVIVWDEDDLSGVFAPDDPIPMIVLSPLAKQNPPTGYQSSVTANHYSLLATIEDAFGLARIGAAAQAQPLSDFFPSN